MEHKPEKKRWQLIKLATGLRNEKQNIYE